MSKNNWLQIENMSEKVGVVHINGVIGSSWFSRSYNHEQFVKDLNALGDVNSLHVYINSPGGSVFEGQAIVSELRLRQKEQGLKITAHIVGLAASMATLIAITADKVKMPKNALFMIHLASTVMSGNAEDLEEESALLTKIDNIAAELYAEKSDYTKEDFMELMSNTTWFSAEELAGTFNNIELEEVSATAKVTMLNSYVMELPEGIIIPEKYQKILDDSKPLAEPVAELVPETIAEPEPEPEAISVELAEMEEFGGVLIQDLENKEKEIIALQEKLAIMEEEKQDAKYVELAKAIGDICVPTDSFAEMCKILDAADNKLYQEFIDMMKAFNIIVSESELFKEFGSNDVQGQDDLVGLDKLEKYARELMKDDATLAYPKAFSKALKEHPECYEEYNKNK